MDNFGQLGIYPLHTFATEDRSSYNAQTLTTATDMQPDNAPDLPTLLALKKHIKQWGMALGFEQVGIAPINLEDAGEKLQQWLRKGYHGTMQYMSRHGEKRYRPDVLLPGTASVISVRMQYLHNHQVNIKSLRQKDEAYIAQYALGRDYHKLMRRRLQKLADRIDQAIPHQYRAFVDSAPVMEKPLAVASGLGWQGKHTVVINQQDGSWFFLGSILTNLPLPPDKAIEDKCGGCKACINICPTQAIVKPYVLDATRCIAYLTIEHKGPIPVALRPLLGNRVFGCDDCQLICPWNRYAQVSREAAFLPRQHMTNQKLITLFLWTETAFERHTEGSVLRRTGYENWLRNVAVALGNAPYDPAVVHSLSRRLKHPSALVREHVLWALKQQHIKRCQTPTLDSPDKGQLQ